MNKRANGEGSVYQRQDGRWTGATYVLRPDGGRVRRQVYGATKAETNTKLRELIQKTERGVPAAPSAWTVELFSTHWLAVMSGSLRPSTLSNYSWVLRKYVLPELGAVKLDRLTLAHVRKLHAAVDRAGASKRTGQLAHAVLRSMLTEAMREELIVRNVASLVKSPKPEQPERKPWTQAEVAKFRIASEGTQHAQLFELAISMGLRRGELLGLRWSDLDLEAGKLHVRQTMQRLGAGRGLVFGPPKTLRSRRTVPIPSTMVDHLKQHRWVQAQRLAENERDNPLDLVFTTAIGTPIEPSNLRRELDRLITISGVRRIRFHDLRHTCASLLFAQGVPARVVMDVLGHSSLSITTDLYAHVMPSALTDAAAAMDQLFTDNRRPNPE